MNLPTSNLKVKQFTIRQENIFLVDGLGALVTSIMLYFVLTPCQTYIGLPKEILLYLTIPACIYFLYSITCHILAKGKEDTFLKPIIIGNLSYCLVTLLLLIYYRDSITILGMLYFVGEIMIICGLVIVETRILLATRQK